MFHVTQRPTVTRRSRDDRLMPGNPRRLAQRWVDVLLDRRAGPARPRFSSRSATPRWSLRRPRRCGSRCGTGSATRSSRRPRARRSCWSPGVQRWSRSPRGCRCSGSATAPGTLSRHFADVDTFRAGRRRPRRPPVYAVVGRRARRGVLRRPAGRSAAVPRGPRPDHARPWRRGWPSCTPCRRPWRRTSASTPAPPAATDQRVPALWISDARAAPGLVLGAQPPHLAGRRVRRRARVTLHSRPDVTGQ